MSQSEDLAALSFEEALRELETIVQQLESGDAPLDKAIDLYGRGDRLRAQCEARLATAQARIEQIQLGQDGKPAGVAPFDAT
ncbi:MAG: exodeoxyribonuclease VII small subunit [Sphingomonadaceae bacterium]|nr:exodeoxyribonuclease VII small subunit [Sphingomonadaceae bacterium]